MAPSVEVDQISPNARTIHFFKNQWFEFDEQLDIIELADRLFWTGPSGPRQATLADLNNGQSLAAGVPKPDAPSNVSTEGDGVGVAFDTFYVVSFVNRFGQEGDKSDPSPTIISRNGQVVTIGNLGLSNQSDQATVLDSGITRMRVYRLSEGEARFVAELPFEDAEFTETLGEITLGEVFPSEDFLPPPSQLTGLHLMANGIALGFVAGERLVYVSEPFNANAWPYFFPTEGVPVGISSYDNNAVIVTDGYPEVAAINDPRNIVPTTLTYREPCLSKLSLVQADGGVIYASSNGLFYIGRGGGNRITKDHLDASDWQRYSPSSIRAMYRDQQYIGFHDGQKEGNALVFDMRSGAELRQMSQTASATFVKPGTDQAFVASEGKIWQLEGSEDRLEYLSRSKLYGSGSPFALTSRRVLSCEHITRSYDPLDGDGLAELFAARAVAIANRVAVGNCFGLGGAINQKLIAGCPEISPLSVQESAPANLRTINGIAAIDIPRTEVISVVFNVYGDKALVHTETISDDEAVQRLTYFDRRRLYSWELMGNLEISQVDLAGSNSEMHDG